MNVTSQQPVYDAVLKTPIGLVGVITRGRDILRIDLRADPGIPITDTQPGPTALAVLDWLTGYFRNPGIAMQLPLSPQGTSHQRRVWSALRRIPAGHVRRYGDIARNLHSSARAVGQACRSNPLPLLIPCHRVVAADGLGGFMGAERGLAIKRWLLAHEGAL